MTTPSPRRSSRLYRDPVDKKIGGVASGVARYFDIDTTLMRAIWAASILVGGFGLFLYLILWFILDEDPELLASLQQAAPVQPAEASNPSGSPQLAPQTASVETETATEALTETETLEAVDAIETAESIDEVEDSNPSSS